MWGVFLASALENAWFRLTFSWQTHINLTDLCKHVYVICKHHMVLYRRLNTQGFGYPQHPTEHGAVSCANQGMTAWIPYTILQGANPSAYLLLHVLHPPGKRLQRPKLPLKIPLSVTPPNITLAPLTQCLDFSACNALTHWIPGDFVSSPNALSPFTFWWWEHNGMCS